MILSESSFWNYLFDTHHIIEYGGLLLILAIIYIETGFFLGFVLPGGDYMLFAAGIFCGTHYLDIPLFLLVLLLITASFMGDFTGYFIGKAYPEVIKYSFYILLLFVAIASFPMLKIMFAKVKKP